MVLDSRQENGPGQHLLCLCLRAEVDGPISVSRVFGAVLFYFFLYVLEDDCELRCAVGLVSIHLYQVDVFMLRPTKEPFANTNSMAIGSPIFP